MPVIHIETNLIAANEYEFTQTFIVGGENVTERIYTESHEDRMYAAMTNLGYACRWYADENISRGDVCIVSDTDGKDVRYSGEHDDLFEAVYSRSDYQKNRAKYNLIYGRYVKFLDRIRDLADAYEIGFTQNAKPLEAIKYEGKEFVQKENINDNNPFLIKNRKWTRLNLIKIDPRGTKNIITCMACQKSISYEQSDNFVPFRTRDSKGRLYLVKSNKHLVQNFQEIHLGQHLNKDNK